jgi:hypothetical protein
LLRPVLREYCFHVTGGFRLALLVLGLLVAPALAQAVCNVTTCNLNDSACVNFGCIFDPDIGTTICDIISIAPSGTVCRASAGACDPEELCDFEICPPNVFSPPTVVCRPATGNCDVAESCTGSEFLCPVNLGSDAACTGNCDACVLERGSYDCAPDTPLCSSCDTCEGSGTSYSCTTNGTCSVPTVGWGGKATLAVALLAATALLASSRALR